MSSELDHLTQIYASAFWGRQYDTDLLNALETLDNAERIARSGEEGEAPHELYSYDAVLHLQAPKSRVAAIRERLESEHGAREASRIIECHYHRIEEVRKSDEFTYPEIFVITVLTEWLRHADGGKIPTASRVAALIESLKAYAPFFKDITNDERRRLASGEALRPMQNVVVWRAQRNSAMGVKTYSETLIWIARYIFDRDLFFGEKVRVDKWVKQLPLPLTPGTDKSRSLFGVVKAEATPRHTSDG